MSLFHNKYIIAIKRKINQTELLFVLSVLFLLLVVVYLSRGRNSIDETSGIAGRSGSRGNRLRNQAKKIEIEHADRDTEEVDQKVRQMTSEGDESETEEEPEEPDNTKLEDVEDEKPTNVGAMDDSVQLPVSEEDDGERELKSKRTNDGSGRKKKKTKDPDDGDDDDTMEGTTESLPTTAEPNDEEVEAKEPCTFALLRSYYEKNHKFAGAGRWVEVDGVHNFRLNFCKIAAPWNPEDDLSKCLLNTGTILSTGDTTGFRYFEALNKIVDETGYTCRVNKQENLDMPTPDNNYYGAGRLFEDYFNITSRQCEGCYGIERSCNKMVGFINHDLKLEHVGFSMLRDVNIWLPYDKDGLQRLSTNIRDYDLHMSFHDFFFRFYMDHNTPDIYIIYVPFNHLKHHLSMKELRQALYIFLRDLHRHMFKSNTKFFFVPSSSEFDDARKESEVHDFDGLTASEKIREMNKLLYEMLQPYILDPESRIWAFLDLWKISLPKGHWSIDGVHMDNVWYEQIMELFLQIYCNSVKFNAF